MTCIFVICDCNSSVIRNYLYIQSTICHFVIANLQPLCFFFFFLINRRPPRSTLFPYPTLFRSSGREVGPPPILLPPGARLVENPVTGTQVILMPPRKGYRCERSLKFPVENLKCFYDQKIGRAHV